MELNRLKKLSVNAHFDEYFNLKYFFPQGLKNDLSV